jgi:hypothetical protein
MFARVGPAQRALLSAVALEHGRVQIQTISGRAFRQPLQLPVPQAGEKTLALSLPKPLEQVANGVVDGKASDSQQLVQGYIGTQQTGMCEPPRPSHHRKQKCREGLHGIDRVGGSETKRQMLPHRFAIAHLPQEFKKHHQPAERRNRTRGLA